MATVRGATLLGPDKLEVREYPVPDIPADGGLVKVEMGGVCGTDVKYLHGKLKVDYPIILGHEILGRVEKLGKNAAAIHHVKEGERIILKGALGCGRCPPAPGRSGSSLYHPCGQSSLMTPPDRSGAATSSARPAETEHSLRWHGDDAISNTRMF